MGVRFDLIGRCRVCSAELRTLLGEPLSCPSCGQRYAAPSCPRCGAILTQDDGHGTIRALPYEGDGVVRLIENPVCRACHSHGEPL